MIFLFLEYLLKASRNSLSFAIDREVAGLQEKMYNQAIDVVQSISEFSNYGHTPRFLTICKFEFSRGNADDYTNLDFTVCFHIISTCPGLKYLFQKTLYKPLKYNRIRMSIKQHSYPQRNCPLAVHNLTNLKLTNFLNRKCNFCVSNGLLGRFHEQLWRNGERQYLNSSLVFNIHDTFDKSSRSWMYYCNSNFKIVQKTSLRRGYHEFDPIIMDNGSFYYLSDTD